MVASPVLELDRHTRLVASAEALRFDKQPEVRRLKQVALGPKRLFGAGSDRKLRFEVYVAHPCDGLRAQVVHRAPDATARPIYIYTEKIEAQTQLPPIDLSLRGLESGAYELMVDPCHRDAEGARICEAGARWRFELE